MITIETGTDELLCHIEDRVAIVIELYGGVHVQPDLVMADRAEGGAPEVV